MNNLLSNRISFFALTTFAFLFLFSFQIQAQTCMTIPDDLTWTCEDDDEYIYQYIDDVIIYDCSDPSIVYETPLPIVVIEELGCSSSVYPGILRRITRTFIVETGNSLDVLCDSLGVGFICDAQVIEVIDTQNPQFIDLLSDITIECDNTAAIELAFSNLPTFNDGCNSNASLNTDSVIIDGACPQNYTVVKTFTVTDACGNISDPHEITITIEDTEAPTITLPIEEFELECSEVLTLEDPVVEDNCGLAILTADTIVSGDISTGDLMSTITYIATDDCGNSSEAEVVVNIIDTLPPFFTNFPEDLLLLCGGDYPNDQASYEDSCDPNAYLYDYDLQFDFQPCASNTEIARTFTIIDNAGNDASQTQYINFLDEDPPILLTPLDSLFYQCAYEVPDCMEIFDGLEFDDCSSGAVVPIECSDVVVEGNCEEQACIIERTYYFVDACGNQGSAKQYITVQESVLAPELPTGMTPNGDGYNDAYVIRGIGPSVNPDPGEVQCDWLEDTRMRVINRWGSIVFETLDYRNDWEGITDSGEDLPQGTYFVVFEAIGESFSTYVDIRR